MNEDVKEKVVLVISVAIEIVVFIFHIIANVVPEWSKSGGSGNETTVGLWKSCTTVSNSSTCVDITCSSADNTYNQFLAARAFNTVACILSPIAALCLFLLAREMDMDMKKRLVWAVKVLAFACFIVGTIGCAIGISATIHYHAETSDSGSAETSDSGSVGTSDLRSAGTSSSLDFGSIIEILANIFELIGGILSLYAEKFI